MNISKYNIELAKTQSELSELVETAAAELHCELDDSMTYAENAKLLDEQDGSEEMAELLRAAESRWFELLG